MILTVNEWKKMILSASDLFEQNVTPLSELDAIIGDGDHGITIGKIAAFLRQKAEDDSITETADLFDEIGMGLLGLPGGSACPLYGTYLGAFGEDMREGDCDESVMKAMFLHAFDEFNETSGAKVGDKTMMDALIPATDAIRKTEGSAAEILRAAADAAKDGADATVNFVAKFGRARNYKERTLGYKDPGAVSMSLLFEGFARALES